MGDDIHAFVERMNHETGSWEYVEPSFYDDEQLDVMFYLRHPDRLRTFYNVRYYPVFKLLAGVRAEQMRWVPTIAAPRGLPSDVSPQVATEAAYYKEDAFSHSYLTLRELLNVKWDYPAASHGSDAMPLRELCGYFYTVTLPHLVELGEPDTIRLVFFFR